MTADGITTDGYMVTMPLRTLKNIIFDAVRISHQEPEYISQNQAYRKFGRRQVERWVSEGLIRPNKDGDLNHKVRYSLQELESCASASNRSSFYNHKYNPLCKTDKIQMPPMPKPRPPG